MHTPSRPAASTHRGSESPHNTARHRTQSAAASPSTTSVTRRPSMRAPNGAGAALRSIRGPAVSATGVSFPISGPVIGACSGKAGRSGRICRLRSRPLILLASFQQSPILVYGVGVRKPVLECGQAYGPRGPCWKAALYLPCRTGRGDVSSISKTPSPFRNPGAAPLGRAIMKELGGHA